MSLPAQHHGPYANLAMSECQRINAYVSTEDKHFIKSLNPSHGATDFILGTLFHSLVLECKENGITYYSPDNTAALRAIVLNRAAARLGRNGLQQDGRTAATQLHPTQQGASNVAPNLQQGPAGGVGERGDRAKPSRKKPSIKEGSNKVSGE